MTGNAGNADFVVFDPDGVSDRAQVRVNFTIEDEGDPHAYKWVIYFRDTNDGNWTSENTGYISGIATAPGPVTDAVWCGEQYNNQGPTMPRGTYTFEVWVKEISDVNQPDAPELDQAYFKSPYRLSIGDHALHFIAEGGTVKARVGYQLNGSKDATAVQVYILNRDLNIMPGTPYSGPTVVNQYHGNLDAYTLDPEDEGGEWKAIFTGEDAHGPKERDHANKRILAVNDEDGLYDAGVVIGWDASANVAWDNYLIKTVENRIRDTKVDDGYRLGRARKKMLCDGKEAANLWQNETKPGFRGGVKVVNPPSVLFHYQGHSGDSGLYINSGGPLTGIYNALPTSVVAVDGTVLTTDGGVLTTSLHLGQCRIAHLIGCQNAPFAEYLTRSKGVKVAIGFSTLTYPWSEAARRWSAKVYEEGWKVENGKYRTIGDFEPELKVLAKTLRNPPGAGSESGKPLLDGHGGFTSFTIYGEKNGRIVPTRQRP